jgi:predicted translin family RNA/ssDNA-binding protein
MSGVTGQGSGGLDRLGSDIEALKRRLQRLVELYPELTGVGISEYVEALSNRSTAEVK